MALRRCLLLFALLLLPLLSSALIVPAARAQDMTELLSGLTDSDPKPAIEALMASDAPQAKAALAALAAGRLYRRSADGAIVIGEPDGAMIVVTNAATGDVEDMADPADLELLELSDTAKAELSAAGVGAASDDTPKDFASAVTALNADDFAAKGKAIEVLTQLGDARAMPVLRALTDGRLFTRKSDGAVVIATRSGNQQSLALATTLEDAGFASNAELDPIVVNNNLRIALREAVGRLGLLSPEAAQRRAAANVLLEGATPDAVALLREVTPKETNAQAKEAMALALAASDIADPAADKQRKLAAVAVLSGATDLRIRSMLQARLNAEADPDVKAALQVAFTSVQRKLTVIGWFANIFQGISLGSVLLLAAVGLAITFGVMGVINMAHGEMIMIGAYATFVVQEIFRAYLPPAWFGAYLVAALPVAFLTAAIFGIAIERGVIRFLYGRPLETMLATWGVSLILQQMVRSIFGAPNKEVSNPSWMTGSFELIGGFDVTWNRVIIIVFCFLVLGLIALILRRTSFGLHMRAVTQNRSMASVMGIPTARVDAMTFALGSGIAGMAGVALSQIGNVSPNLGTIYIVDSFLVVVFGGVGNLMGTLVGAMTLGIVNKLLEPVAGAVLGKVVVLVAIILFIQKRPRGLFAAKGRSADA
ncbi:urea ABC transporter permease subunit UrtB [Ferrovibrio sp.]|uniref:urea ABC transporter permease subunit UrtB n=1 Tax=Ferrovibrio sp. TaxID=1917215 RepID=UPI0025C41FAE|nr:urea ABC transporter permease subunit UrtB [Ferrovibrio sp.]